MIAEILATFALLGVGLLIVQEVKADIVAERRWRSLKARLDMLERNLREARR